MSNDFNLYIKDKQLTETEKVKKRQQFINNFYQNSSFKELFDIDFPIQRVGSSNCENLIGSVEIPVGLVGPIKVNHLVMDAVDKKLSKKNSKIVSDKNSKKKQIENIFIPLATTEGALVASINRGCKVLNLSNSLSAVVKKVGMTRALVFECPNTIGAHEFVNWIEDNQQLWIDYCERTSSHLRFLSYQSFIRGRLVYLRFSFDTGEAMGMNMITIALKDAWEKIKQNHKKVKLLSISGNVCTDKKDSMINRMFGRGFSVELEVFISNKILSDILHVKTDKLVKSHVAKNLIGSNVAGSMAQNMHVANALVAFYIATGQDPAHSVGGSEASVIFEKTNDGLYVALTLPTVSVGSVGGGTWLPKQTQARSLINPGKVRASTLALSAGIAALAGEISGLSALSNNSLACAHSKLGRINK